MTNLSEHVWLVLAGLAGWGLLKLLELVSLAIQNATSVHDLKVQVAKLRLEHISRRNPDAPVIVDVAPEPVRAAA